MLDAAKAREISKMLCVCIELDDFEPMYEKIAEYEHIYSSVGIHPCHVTERAESVKTLLEFANRPRIIALGETGLDYHYKDDNKAVQQESFANHLEASSESGLPVIVHTRNAREDTLGVIREAGDESVGGVLHCFTENWEMAKAALDLNYMISFSGIITFKNAAELREVVQKVPLDRILIETDSPYLAPIPYRGKQNEPKYVVEVAQQVAELKGVSVEEVAQTTADNFHRLFTKA